VRLVITGMELKFAKESSTEVSLIDTIFDSVRLDSNAGLKLHSTSISSASPLFRRESHTYEMLP
jgi:hypothetical protein